MLPVNRLRALEIAYCAFAVSFAVWVQLQPVSPAVTVAAGQVGQSFAAVLGAVGCGIAAYRGCALARRSWLLLTIACASWAAGQFIWTWYQVGLHVEVPFPSAADVGYVGFFPLAIGALIWWPGRSSALGRARLVLDAVLVSTSLLLVSWVAVLHPIWLQPGGDRLARVIALAYPAGDVLVATMAIATIARTAGRRSPLLLIAAGLLAMVGADTAFAVMTQQGTWAGVNAANIGWTSGLLLIGLGGLRAAATPVRPVSDDSPTFSSQVLPYVAALAAVGCASYQQVAHGRLDGVVALLALAIVLAAMARQLLHLHETQQLRRELESRVVARTADLSSSERRFRAMVMHSADAISIVGADGLLTYVSPSVELFAGLRADQLLGRNLLRLWDGQRDGERYAAVLAESLRRPGESIAGEFELLRPDGKTARFETTFTNLIDEPAVHGVVLNSRDTTERRRLEQDLARQAFHDSLTDLPNRALFRERLTQALRRPRHPRPLGVMLIDLDGFKAINDTLGHTRGDTLLAEVATRLVAAVRTDDTVARLGGDEFGVLVENADRDTVLGVARRLTEALADAFIVSPSREVLVRASIGIAYATSGDETVEDLLRNADLAMYAAKSDRATPYAEYRTAMHDAVTNRVQLEEDLRCALRRQEFVLHYQPVVELETGVIRGVEALVRWQHPARGLVRPLDFIPLAEESGLIIELGQWVLETAAAQSVLWRAQLGAGPQFDVAINVSGEQLKAPRLAQLVREVVARTGAAPSDLVLEMTESTMMEDSEATLAALRDLRQIGVQLAIDDFGTGYSSLSYLRQFSVDILKIDKSFVDGIAMGADESAVARAVLRLGQTMHLTTIAEGIEHESQRRALVELGCPLGQGYLFSRPVPAAEITAMVAALVRSAQPTG